MAFPYGDLAATEELLTRYQDDIACLILEPATHTEPPPGYLAGLRELADRHGCVLIFDEMITGFRWSEAGAQGLYGVVPDLSTFGKALGNGFAVSALAGRRDLMERGGLRHSGERVFLLSTTHGAETHSLAAAMAVQTVYAEEGVTARLHTLGERLAAGVRAAAAGMGVGDHIVVRGRASNLVFATLDENGQPSQEYRTLFLQQAPRRRGAGPVVRGEQRAQRRRHRSHRRGGGPGVCGVPEGTGRRRPQPLDGRTTGEAGVPSLGVTSAPLSPTDMRPSDRPTGQLPGRPATRSPEPPPARCTSHPARRSDSARPGRPPPIPSRQPATSAAAITSDVPAVAPRPSRSVARSAATKASTVRKAVCPLG